MDPQPPLTHHEIVELAAPLVRQGWAVDLAACDRAARRIEFRPRAHAAAEGLPAQRESWTLDVPSAGRQRLTRTLVLEGPEDAAAAQVTPVTPATLWAEGADAAALLARLSAVPPARQFVAAGGTWAALRQRLPAAAHAPPVLLGATAQVAGLTLQLKVSGVQGFPAELELLRPAGDARRLPEDLLAVLGRRWDRLTALSRGWVGQLALRGPEPRRSDEARAGIAMALEHLARTLAEPPARFHERHRGARWRVALRGSGPVLAGAALVGLALHLQSLGDAYSSYLGLLANLAPPLLMGLFFLRREMPRIGLPRPPRPLRADAWNAS
ncbi:MAG: hypothetical protein ACK51Z_13230 [Pseudomonadota bacterium]|nr:hypothetical protein [Rubrivivax sp.]MCA3257076.1 hypothetical protein [Rubrivivax sp.]MCZ8029420.1 hypothetical protein [Rubrivivax sp.]